LGMMGNCHGSDLWLHRCGLTQKTVGEAEFPVFR
jgi:hypothetical protein